MPTSPTQSHTSRPPQPLTGPSSVIDLFFSCLQENQENGSVKKGLSSILNAFYDFARWTTRSLNPFIVYENVWAVGLYHWAQDQGKAIDIPKPNFEGDVLQLYLLIFEKMQESIVGFDRVLDQPMTGIYLPSKLGKQMDNARGTCLAFDAHRMKERITTYVDRILPNRKLEPPLTLTHKKELCMGWNHPQLAALLIPLKYLGAYKENPALTISQVMDGTLVIRGSDFPAFLYPFDTPYKPSRPRDECFHGLLWIFTFKALFTGPATATQAEFNGLRPKHCQAYHHGLTKVTPETIAYAAMHTYYAISNAREWRTDMGTFDKKEFFTSMVTVLSKESRWQKKLFRWANTRIFGSPDGAASPRDKPKIQGPSDVELFLKQTESESESESDENEINEPEVETFDSADTEHAGEVHQRQDDDEPCEEGSTSKRCRLAEATDTGST
ncbi:hypothetical protein Agabi119p4_2336 [Agaricus bisporus var. burnettii]|uniref:Fungal-type protein kinase domain-containing protein n=1 Tax=Agaricus bisporus var. burnettii TaxID=192524 RepID=A0A8H7F8W3_AGABI|nr:hypothetical protein Agabi119p4_2336 [Agaricus bisporus var. burnettii]